MTAAAITVVGCSSPEDAPQGSEPQHSAGNTVPSQTIPDASPTSATPIPGVDEQAVRAALTAFIPKWGEYSPWGPGNPKRTYFESWQAMATDSFGLREFRNFDQQWSWTWGEEKKAYFAEAVDINDVTITDGRAEAEVTMRRHVLGVLGRMGDDVTQEQTYQAQLKLRDGKTPLIDAMIPQGDMLSYKTSEGPRGE